MSEHMLVTERDALEKEIERRVYAEPFPDWADAARPVLDRLLAERDSLKKEVEMLRERVRDDAASRSGGPESTSGRRHE